MRLLTTADAEPIAAAFAAIGWTGKTEAQYRRYVAEQEAGTRVVWVAAHEDTFAGYVCVVCIGVGIGADYGAAFRLYVTRGFVPDGRGVAYAGKPVAIGDTIRVDDSANLYFTRGTARDALPRRTLV